MHWATFGWRYPLLLPTNSIRRYGVSFRCRVNSHELTLAVASRKRSTAIQSAHASISAASHTCDAKIATTPPGCVDIIPTIQKNNKKQKVAGQPHEIEDFIDLIQPKSTDLGWIKSGSLFILSFCGWRRPMHYNATVIMHWELHCICNAINSRHD